MIIFRLQIICTVRPALRTVNIKALLLHALRRTVVIKYMSESPRFNLEVHTQLASTDDPVCVCT